MLVEKILRLNLRGSMSLWDENFKNGEEWKKTISLSK